MNNLEKRLISNQTDLIYDNLLVSDKIKLDNRIFHSKKYSRKGNCDSYSISFNYNSLIKYGQIDYFFEYNNEVYAVIQVFKIKPSISDILPGSSGDIYNLIKENNLLDKYFKLVNYNYF